MAIHSPVTIGKIRNGIAGSKDFKVGNISGRSNINPWMGAGRLPNPQRLDFWEHCTAGTIDYVVYSYATPIAWRGTSGWWYMPPIKYSPTTADHQRVVRAITDSPPATEQARVRTETVRTALARLNTRGHRSEPITRTPSTHAEVLYEPRRDVVADIDRLLAEVAGEGWTNPYSDTKSPARKLA